ERRALWDAFTHGLNHYLRSHPEVPRRLLSRYEPWMLFARAAWFDAATMADSSRLGTLAGAAGVPAPEVMAVPDHSWGWAIAPGASGTGEALLVAGLDGPWFGT